MTQGRLIPDPFIPDTGSLDTGKADTGRSDAAGAGFAIPDYTVRVSKRARRVAIRVSPWAGLEVVIPPRFSRKGIPELLQLKSDWIARNLERIQPVEALERPGSIDLRLLNENWQTEYLPSPGERLRTAEQEGNLLSLTGPVADPAMVAAALNGWLQRRAKAVLTPWLEQLSEELSLPFNRVTVRRQRTKWGSCSSERSINLNRNLLFLPEPMARYVLVHELCHGRRLDHSERFWSLLETYQPGARATAAKVREASQLVPRWAQV
ncbi:MAG: SprT family zinc-dependent metalloprotease [Chloroflexi bacterium]|nr:SprT family zinc-dependent metalloprotease [Chloroflexota bacterium]MDA1272096.1 SprT family zinc-dependent metalloprotease [Chloroflexota bacterium]